MKNLILSAAILISITAAAATPDTNPENEKVLKTFREVFKNPANAVWSNVGDYYEVFFTNASVKTRAKFDSNGSLIETVRYYKESELPANVLYHVKKAYPAKEVWGVTEVTNNNGVNYRIVLRDAKNYLHINANDAGETETVSKYKRGDK
ncbi:MAG: hypothetical protein QM640_06755 [Niabella sp.]